MPFTPRLVLVTVSNMEEARQLKKDPEVVMLIKSSAEEFETLAGYVRKHHSYECPEILSIPPHEISPGYRSWWDESMMKAVVKG